MGPSSIQRGLEWTQLLKRLFFVPCLSSNFLIFPSFILLFLYSTVQKSAVQYSYFFIKLSLLLANSLEYPQRIEWSQSLNRLSVCSLFFVCLVVCLQIFSFFPLSSSSFYTVQYRRVQYSTVIGQLPRVSTEDRVVSVFEPCVCLSVPCVSSNFLIFPSFILLFLYSTVQLFIGQLPQVSTEDRVVSVFEFRVCLSDCSLLDCKFSNFFLFHPSLFIQYSTEECSTVQYKKRRMKEEKIRKFTIKQRTSPC